MLWFHVNNIHFFKAKNIESTMTILTIKTILILYCSYAQQFICTLDYAWELLKLA